MPKFLKTPKIVIAYIHDIFAVLLSWIMAYITIWLWEPIIYLCKYILIN